MHHPGEPLHRTSMGPDRYPEGNGKPAPVSSDRLHVRSDRTCLDRRERIREPERLIHDVAGRDHPYRCHQLNVHELGETW